MEKKQQTKLDLDSLIIIPISDEEFEAATLESKYALVVEKMLNKTEEKDWKIKVEDDKERIRLTNSIRASYIKKVTVKTKQPYVYIKRK